MIGLTELTPVPLASRRARASRAASTPLPRRLWRHPAPGCDRRRIALAACAPAARTRPSGGPGHNGQKPVLCHRGAPAHAAPMAAHAENSVMDLSSRPAVATQCATDRRHGDRDTAQARLWPRVVCPGFSAHFTSRRGLLSVASSLRPWRPETGDSAPRFADRTAGLPRRRGPQRPINT